MKTQLANSVRALGLSALLGCSLQAQAGQIDIYEFSVYVAANELGGTSLRDTAIGVGPDTLTSGLDVTFSTNLDSDGFGTMTWSLTNNTGSDLTGVSLFGFLDADIDETINTFFNEVGLESDFMLGAGSSDGFADSFEIDEPGFLFGDIIANLLAGSLDNTNSVAPGAPDDVSMALGFDVGMLLADQSLTATFDIAAMNNGGLIQFDPGSDFQFWYNGFIELSDVGPTPVPVPATFALILAGAVGFLGARRHRQALLGGAGAFFLVFLSPGAMAGLVPTVDENPPICDCFSKDGKTDSIENASRSYDSFEFSPFPFVFCNIFDGRPSEDVNGNGVLDPGEDLNGNGEIDADTGIFEVSLAEGSVNAELFTFFSPGDPLVFADISSDDFGAPASFTLRAVDGAGNMCEPAIQLGPLDPTGGLDFFPPTPITLPIPVPPNPADPPVAVQCIDFPQNEFPPTPGQFDGVPFVPINGDPTTIPGYQFAGDGPRGLCCQFELQGGAVSSPFCAFPFVEPGITPPAPVGLVGRPKPTKIDLLWDAVENADEYIVLRRDGLDDTLPFEQIGTSDITLYVDFTAEPAVFYAYAVQAVVDGMVSDPSKALTVFIPAIRGDDKKAK